MVNDGHVNSTASSVTITVTSDLAMLATATASSEATAYGQTAAKAIDGVVDGFPGDHTKEWSTNGGRVGSWLKLNLVQPGCPGHDRLARPTQRQRPDHLRHPDLQ